MPLSDKEKAQLEALQRKADEPDEPDFEVEWWEESADGSRRGGRMPWSKGKQIYGKHFPDLFGDAPDGDDGQDDDGKQAPKDAGARRLFQTGKQQAS